MEYDSIPYALLYEENDKPALSEICTLLSKTYVFVGCCLMWAGPQKVLFLKQALPFSLSFLKYIIFRLNNSCHVVAQNGGDLCSQSCTLLSASCFCVSYLVVIYFK